MKASPNLTLAVGRIQCAIHDVERACKAIFKPRLVRWLRHVPGHPPDRSLDGGAKVL